MNMQATAIGLVPLARAAQLLTGSGKPIHPSNLSRYLDRYPTIKNEKRGRVRFVDFEALQNHRATNIGVIEKAATAPLLESPPAKPAAPPPAEDEQEPLAAVGGELSNLNAQLRRVQLRQAQLDLAERERQMLPVAEVFGLVSTVMSTFIEALQRSEGEMAQAYGREVATTFRQKRKAAQASASATLAKMAKDMLEPADATRAVDAANGDVPQA